MVTMAYLIANISNPTLCESIMFWEKDIHVAVNDSLADMHEMRNLLVSQVCTAVFKKVNLPVV